MYNFNKNQYYNILAKNCHKITKIYPNFFIGGKSQIMESLRKGMKFDVLIPLDSLDGNVWKYINPYETDIFFFPVPDYGILNTENLDFLVKKVLCFLKENKKVALFCLGGHGRTGYVSACILGKLGIKNPVEKIRNNYCEKTIETYEQMMEVQNYLGIDLSKYTKEMLKNEFAYYLEDEIRIYLVGLQQKMDKEKKEVQFVSTKWLSDCSLEELISIAKSLKIKIPEKYNILME